jgi:hypothetical protein
MNLVFRLAWRNLWRHSKRTWLTTGAMIFSNVLLIFMIGLQFGMYDLMIDNTLQTLTGHVQIQAPGYKDDQKMRQSVADVAGLASSLRTELGSDRVAARGAAFALVSSEDRSYGIAVLGVEPGMPPKSSSAQRWREICGLASARSLRCLAAVATALSRLRWLPSSVFSTAVSQTSTAVLQRFRSGSFRTCFTWMAPVTRSC